MFLCGPSFAVFYVLFQFVGGFGIHRPSERLIRGKDVYIEDFPYYAGLLNCGAAILSKDWVITAAHCVKPPTPNIPNFVWIGGISFHSSKIVSYDRIVFPKNVDNEAGLAFNDIALLHLSKPLKFSSKIQPVQLPFEDLTRSGKDDNLVVAGRGTTENGHVAPNLQKINVRRLTTEKCLSYLPYLGQSPLAEKSLICTTRLNGNAGLCTGDSGSPLMQGNMLIGIVSFILKDKCQEAKVGFYVNIENHVPWIKSVTGL